MFWHTQKNVQDCISCCLFDHGYSLSIVRNNKQVLFTQSRKFAENDTENLITTFVNDIESLHILAKDCQIILIPGQYQLLLMDAIDIPEAEMAKALRWNLKGLSDYDIDDMVLDTCSIPNDETTQKKIFVAVASASKLKQKIALCTAAFLNVVTVTVAEIALRNLLPLMHARHPMIKTDPIIIISVCNHVKKLHIAYQEYFYLIRELITAPAKNHKESIDIDNLTYEIERSIDFCINQLNLSAPKYIFFTPWFGKVKKSLKMIGEKLNLPIELIDLNDYLIMTPTLSLEQQDEVFYSITGSLTYTEDTEEASLHETTN